MGCIQKKCSMAEATKSRKQRGREGAASNPRTGYMCFFLNSIVKYNVHTHRHSSAVRTHYYSANPLIKCACRNPDCCRSLSLFNGVTLPMTTWRMAGAIEAILDIWCGWRELQQTVQEWRDAHWFLVPYLFVHQTIFWICEEQYHQGRGFSNAFHTYQVVTAEGCCRRRLQCWGEVQNRYKVSLQRQELWVEMAIIYLAIIEVPFRAVLFARYTPVKIVSGW